MKNNKSNGKNQARRRTTVMLTALTLLTLSLVPTKSWSQVFLEMGDDAGGMRAQSQNVYVYELLDPIQGIDADESLNGPIGDGLAILGGLGIAYLLSSKRKKQD